MDQETTKAYIDTHIIIDLFENDLSRLSKKAIQTLESFQITIPSISILELGYLYEIKRITYEPEDILSKLIASVDASLSQHQFSSLSLQALSINWTRDPFDRLIVAEADLQKDPLVTLDKQILKHYRKAIN